MQMQMRCLCAWLLDENECALEYAHCYRKVFYHTRIERRASQPERPCAAACPAAQRGKTSTQCACEMCACPMHAMPELQSRKCTCCVR